MAQFYREIHYAEDDENEEYPIDELAGLEDQAAKAEPYHQARAFAHVANVLAARGIVYGGMGGFNFYNLGSTRETQDVDVAVSSSPRMDKILDYFNDDAR